MAESDSYPLGHPAHASDDDIVVVGYCQPVSVRAGDAVTLHASSLVPTDADLDLVRLVNGHHRRFDERPVTSGLPPSVTLDHHPIEPGSWASATADLPAGPLAFGVHVFPTGDAGTILTVGDSVTLRHRDRCVEVVVDGEVAARCDDPMWLRRWYEVTLADGTLSVQRHGILPAGEADPDRVVAVDVAGPGGEADVRFGGGGFDGRLARPWVGTSSWHLPRCRLHQLPDAAVTGPDWDGSAWSPDARTDHYDAVHFHGDDLHDAGWPATATLDLPADLPSGIYCFRLRTPHGTDHTPFFVRPAPGAPTADVAFLAPVATYLAYANHRMGVDGAEFFDARRALRPTERYLRDRPEVGLSMYEYHRDGHGVAFSSHRRPVMNMKPRADGWAFTPDTDIVGWLDHTEVAHDVITDEDVHADGLDALAPYRVVVTGSHPEYWSTAMLDALDAWLADGGRLMYLGGNGFYWRVAFSDDWPGAMEVRRTEDGTRAWTAEPGEGHHAFGGEYGGLWRRLGRPPNRVAGVGFAAQGFDRAAPYRLTEAAADPRVAWMFDGVGAGPGDDFGAFGVGGGAAGQEIDRFDPRLGSPPHALVVGVATDFTDQMLRTKEEFHATVIPQVPDPRARADLTFFETPSGGAVFSTGSISWFGALPVDAYDNDVARLTGNVLRRFADPTPFSPPAPR